MSVLGVMKEVLTLLCLLGSSSAFACGSSPKQVLQLVHEGKSESVVNDIWPTSDCESMILQSISAGSHVWIDAALKLYEHTDASYSEGIHDSLGKAMQVAPSRVLPLVNTEKHSASHICMPWMMDDSGNSDHEYKAITKRARAMFESFLKTRFRPQAEACLGVVAQTEAGLKKGRGA